MTAPIFATLGCRLNAYETEAMKELAAAAGVTGAVVGNTFAVTSGGVRKAQQGIRPVGRGKPRCDNYCHWLCGADRTGNLCGHAGSGQGGWQY